MNILDASFYHSVFSKSGYRLSQRVRKRVEEVFG